jgi:tetratricopeptide (TPR) repeat protein
MYEDDDADDDSASEEYMSELLSRYQTALDKGESLSFMEEELCSLCEYFLDAQDLEQEEIVTEWGLCLYPQSNFFLIHKANLMLDKEMVEEAEALMEKVQDKDEDDVDYFRVYGRIFLLKGEWEKAEEFLKITLGLSEYTDVLAMGLLAGIYNTLGNYNEALKMADLVLREYTEDDELRERAMLDMAMAYQELGDIDGAIFRYQQLIDADPYNAHAWQYLGTFYNDTGLFEKALQAFDYSITIDPEISLAHYHQGLTYLNLKDIDKAYESMNEGLRLNPADPILICGVGICHEKKGDFRMARKFFGDTLAIEPGYAEAWYGLGNCDRDNRQFARAAEHFQKATELDPMEENYWFCLAETLIDLREFGKAEAALLSLLNLNSLSIVGRLLLADLYFDTRESIKAQLVLAKGEELHAQNGLFFYLQAACYLNNGLRTDALHTLQTALDLEPGGFHAFLNAAPDAGKLKSFVSLINKYR